MIEVEKKFSLTPEQIRKIESTAEFVGEVKNTDIYYDTPDYRLVKKDWWFRNRDGKFEIKISPENKSALINVYEEIADPEKIIQRLNLKKLSDDFEESLKLNGFQILVKLVTKRRKFKIKDFNIDIDEVDYGYTLCEIEKMVENESEIEKATQEVFKLAESLGLEIKKVRGKGMEYFYRFNREVYDAFQNSPARKRYE